MSIIPPLPSRVLLSERTQEIFEYIRFVKTVLNNNARLQLPATNLTVPIKKELTHTLKANGYLLLYNVVEASMTQAIADIHSTIENQLDAANSQLALDKMNSGLYAYILRRFKLGQEEVSVAGASQWSGRMLVKYWLRDHINLVKANKNPLFSGNIDGKKIEDIAKKYGYATYGVASRLKHEGLFKAKIKRNMLAHGEKSFMDCGKDISVTELLKDAIGVIRCLRHNISAIEFFIADAGYELKALPATS